MPPMKARDCLASTQNPAALSWAAAPSMTESPMASFGIGVSSHWLTLGSNAIARARRCDAVVAAASVAGGGGCAGSTGALVGPALTVGAALTGGDRRGATVVGAAVVGAAARRRRSGDRRRGGERVAA